MCYLKEHPSTNTTFFLTFSHWLVVFIQEKNYRFETPHWRNIKKWHCWKVKNEAVEVDFRDHNVERKISIPVYLERQVFGIDGLIQLFNLIIVQLFIRIFKAINSTYKSFLQERILICIKTLTKKSTECQGKPVNFWSIESKLAQEMGF